MTDLPASKRRPVALVCLEAALYQLKKGRHLFLIHPVKSTLWAIPQAQLLSSNPAVSWGRSAACPLVSVTSSCARRQLEPLLCRHRAIHKNSHQSFDSIISKSLHDLANLTTTILGDSTVGSHLSVLTDISGLRSRKRSCMCLWLKQSRALSVL